MVTPPPQAGPTSPETGENAIPETPPVLTSPVPTNVKKAKTTLAIVLPLLAIILAAVGIYFFFFSGKLPEKGPSGITQTQGEYPRYFINCDDSRHVIEEGNLLYVACLGGVLIVDRNTGEVKDQIGLPDGLNNGVATSLVKKGDILYIGSQDGITVFNLKTRQARRVSVEEGLVNGANVELFEDGDKIWVITFDGVTLYDTVRGTLTNYTTELNSLSSKRNIVNALLTEKYVYFLEVASAYSSGAIIRYDRATGVFKTYGPGAFGVTGPYARIDFFNIGNFGSRIFASWGSQMYMMDEAEGETWEKIESPYDFIKEDKGLEYPPAISVLRNTDSRGILLSAENKIYRYVPDTGATEIVYDFGKSYADIMRRGEGGKIWLRHNSRDENWLSVLNLASLSLTDLKLKDRPISFSQLVAVIDGKPIIETGPGVFRFEPETNKFTELIRSDVGGVEDYGEPVFEPVPGTSEIFLVRQVCGQGCGKPLIQIFDYANSKVSDIEVPEDTLAQITGTVMGQVSYPAFNLVWKDLAAGDLGFADYGGKAYLVFNLESKSWRIVSEIPEVAIKFNNNDGVFCNRIYTFAPTGKFDVNGCNGKAENEDLSWTIVEDRVIETDKATGERRALNPPALEPDYSPFETTGIKANVSGVMFAKDRLWIKSDRGLIAYSPNDASYKVYGPSDGLLNKGVTQVLVGDYLWVLTNWGGLSILRP